MRKKPAGAEAAQRVSAPPLEYPKVAGVRFRTAALGRLNRSTKKTKEKPEGCQKKELMH